MYEKKIALGFVRVHILHHASQPEGIYGSWMITELEHHGYDISPGTLYPILHDMKKDGLLTVSETIVGGKVRKVYRTTVAGDEALAKMREAVRELSREVLE